MTECSNCKHRERIPGSAHISCKNPPLIAAGSKGRANREQAKKALDKILEGMSDPVEVVIKKNWQGCGIFPINFDENTILACTNKAEGREK